MARASVAYWLLSALVLAQHVVAQDPTPTQNTDTGAQTPNTGYNGGDDNPKDPTEAGAAGTQQGGFSLSKGGLAAIIVVISLVVVLGGKISLPYPQSPILTRVQPPRQSSFGSRRSANGMSASPCVAPLAV